MDATAESTADGWTLVLVRELKHPPGRVWTALTEPAELAAWAPFAAERSLTGTGDLTLTVVDGDERVDLPATVTVVDPPRLLEYRWGEDRLRWELAPTDAGARLTLRHLVAGPNDLPVVAAAADRMCSRRQSPRRLGITIRPSPARTVTPCAWCSSPRPSTRRSTASPAR